MKRTLSAVLLVLGLVASVVVGGGVATAATAPAAPTGVTAAVTAPGTVTLQWSSRTVTGGSRITGYVVSRDGSDSTGYGAWSTVVPAGARSQTFTQLLPDRWYSFSVAARTAAGTGPATTVSSSVPLPGAPFTWPAQNTGTATVAWSPPWTTNGATITGYRVARSGYDTDGAGAWSAVVPAGSRSFTFTKLGPTSYTATVQAITAGTGPASTAPMYVDLPPIVMGQVGGYGVSTNRSAGSATITWRVDPAGNHWQTPDGFLVDRDGVDSSGAGPWSTTVGSTTRSFTFTKLTPGVTYRLSLTPYVLWQTGKASGPTALTQTVTVRL